MYKIIQAPHAVLARPAKKVGTIDDLIKKLVEEMTVTLENARDPEGVGLAAPQIGKSLQLFVVKEGRKSPVLVYINPAIEAFVDKKKPKTKKDDDVKLEGCLSVADVWGAVDRHDGVKLSYTDLLGKRHTEVFKGFFATIVQHECDHLQGILFPQRVLEQKGTLYKSHKNKEGEMVFDEISL